MMNLERRDFLKVLSAGALTAGNVTSVFAGIRKTLSADAVGILYDGTICIGCKACEAACKQYNDMSPESSNSNNAVCLPRSALGVKCDNQCFPIMS